MLVCENFKGTELALTGEFQPSQDYTMKRSQKNKQQQQETKDKVTKHRADAFDMEDSGRLKDKTVLETGSAIIYR